MRHKNTIIKLGIQMNLKIFFKIGHSLGSLIAADIVSENMTKRYLNFTVNTLVTLGSPAPMFIAIREKNDLDMTSYIRCVDHWINVLNHNDPVAYRFGRLFIHR